MRNEERKDGYATSDINLAAAMCTTGNAEFRGIEGEGKEKLFVLSGNPKTLADYKHKWFNGEPFGNLKTFAKRRKDLLAVLPRG